MLPHAKPLSPGNPSRRALGGDTAPYRLRNGAYTATWYEADTADPPSQSRQGRASALWCDCPRQSLPFAIASLLPEGEPLRCVTIPSGTQWCAEYYSATIRIVSGHCPPIPSGAGKGRLRLHCARIGCRPCRPARLQKIFVCGKVCVTFSGAQLYD